MSHNDSSLDLTKLNEMYLTRINNLFDIIKKYQNVTNSDIKQVVSLIMRVKNIKCDDDLITYLYSQYRTDNRSIFSICNMDDMSTQCNIFNKTMSKAMSNVSLPDDFVLSLQAILTYIDQLRTYVDNYCEHDKISTVFMLYIKTVELKRFDAIKNTAIYLLMIFAYY